MKNNLKELMNWKVDNLVLTIPRMNVMNQNITEEIEWLQGLIKTPEIAKYFQGKIDIIFDGYQNVKDELWEINEVKDFVAKLDSEFPYWLYFLSDKTIVYFIQCLLKDYPNDLCNYLLGRGFPAMNYIADFALDNKMHLTDRITKCFFGNKVRDTIL